MAEEETTLLWSIAYHSILVCGLERALEIAGRIEDPDRRDEALDDMIGWRDYWLGAEEPVVEQRDDAQPEEAPTDPAHIAWLHVDAGRFEAALSVAAQIEDDADRDDCLWYINQSSLRQDAFPVAERAIRIVCAPEKRVAHWRALGCKRARLEDFEEAVVALQETEPAARRADLRSNIALEILKHIGVEPALTVARGIPEWGARDFTLGRIALHMARQGEADRARALAVEIQKPRKRNVILLEIGIVLKESGADTGVLSGDSQVCTRIAHDALEAGLTADALAALHAIRALDKRSLRLAEFAVAFQTGGDRASADALFAEALSLVGDLPHGRLRDGARARIVHSLTEAGRGEAALSLTRQIERPALRAQVLAELPQSRPLLVADPRPLFEEAVAVARTIGDPEPRRESLLEVANRVIQHPLTMAWKVDYALALAEEIRALRGIPTDRRE